MGLNIVLTLHSVCVKATRPMTELLSKTLHNKVKDFTSLPHQALRNSRASARFYTSLIPVKNTFCCKNIYIYECIFTQCLCL